MESTAISNGDDMLALDCQMLALDCQKLDLRSPRRERRF